MKIKKALSTFILGSIIWFGFLGICCGAGYAESIYSRPVVCSDFYYDGNTAVYEFTDTCGEEWEWTPDSTSESYQIGNSYKLIMFDEKTTSIYDDSILKIKEK